MLAESLYLLVLLLTSALAVKFTHSPLVLVVLLLLCLPLVTTLFSLYCAPFVPSNKKKIELMFKFAQLKPGVTLFDLGAGDGRLLRRAELLGVNAIGYEISFPLVLSFYIRGIFQRTKVRMYWKSLWKANLADADVIFVYLLDKAMIRFGRECFPKLKKGTKVISNTFIIPGLKPNKVENGVYLYIKE